MKSTTMWCPPIAQRSWQVSQRLVSWFTSCNGRTHTHKERVDIFRAYSYPSHLLGKKVERNGININTEALWRPKICEVWLYSSDLHIQNRLWEQF